MSSDTTMHYSLLDEQLFTVTLYSDAGPQRTMLSLPSILAALDSAAPQIASFEALQAHQQQAWFCFLVQLGAIARHRQGLPPEACEEAWRAALRALAGGELGAWCLVHAPLDKPAFMQPPIPEGSLKAAGFEGNHIPTPDLLDVLLTAKNHDVKATRMRSDTPEHWIYALVTLQTMEGYSGPKNYGIVRMNGGFASRPMVGLAPSLDWGARWRRDVSLALTQRDAIVDNLGFVQAGHPLLWLLPWDGEPATAINLAECDPYVIEVCRRVRVIHGERGITCLKAPSNAGRIAHGNDLKGLTGDLWMPLQHERDGAKGLTITGRGFSYDLLRKLLLRDELTPSPAQSWDESDTGALLLWTSGMTRGQGKTEGLHQRLLLIPPQAQRRIRQDATRLQLATRAQEQVKLTAAIRSKALYAALKALYAGGITDQDHTISEHWTQRYEQEADALFFDHLFEHIDVESDKDVHRVWLEKMRSFAHALLLEACQAAPVPSGRRWRAAAVAEQIFESSFYRHKELAFYMQTPEEAEEVRHEDE